MITSSQFFQKSFFTLENNNDNGQIDELSPWGLMSDQHIQHQNNKAINLKQRKKSPPDNRGYEISRNSSLKYIQKKLKAKSQIHKTRQLIVVEQSPKYHTIQQKLRSIQSHKSTVKYADSVQIAGKLKKNRRKHLFPQLTINQYNDIKAKGNGLMNINSNPIEQILERRKNRRKILEQFGKGTIAHNKMSLKIKQSHNKSIQSKSVLSGRYVYIAKNPQFSVNGLPTTKLMDQY